MPGTMAAGVSHQRLLGVRAAAERATARAQLSGVSTSAVGPQAIISRASSSVYGNHCRTMSCSCRAATMVMPCACQLASSPSNTCWVVTSMPTKGSSSTTICASCRISWAKRTRWNSPPDSALMSRPA